MGTFVKEAQVVDDATAAGSGDYTNSNDDDDLNNNNDNADDDDEGKLYKGFADGCWQVHKFGGTSVANADCFLKCAVIVENQMGIYDNDNSTSNNNTSSSGVGGGELQLQQQLQQLQIAVVVSAMGGKPKVTDLLLDSVTFAAERNQERVEQTLQHLLDKHRVCLQALFATTDKNENTTSAEMERLYEIVQQDISDIRDILKTVSLMKWQASKIRELVSGYGELWSAQILAALLQQRAVTRFQQEQLQQATATGSNLKKDEFVYLDARRVITIDEDDDNAVAWTLSQQKLEQVYQTELQKLQQTSTSSLLHFVMTGYVASNTHGVATTLQRDGSDYSASILGRLLSASAITIWTDVNGVLTADPRRVPLAQVVDNVSYNEAMELAYFGAKVIHPKTMQPAITAHPRQIPIYIRNTFEPAFRGTRIYTSSTSATSADDQTVVCGFSSIEQMALINVEGAGMMGVPGVAKRLFGTLETIGISVVLISQASSEHSITFATVEKQAAQAVAAIEDEFRRELGHGLISQVDVKSPCSIIAAVGDGMAQATGVSGRFFSALGDAKINVLAIAQGCSERNISAVVHQADSTRALRAVHAAFRLSHTTIRVAVLGMNELGESLLKLLDTQRNAIRADFDIDLQVCAVLPTATTPYVLALQHDTDDGSAHSITIGAFQHLTQQEQQSEKQKNDKDTQQPPQEKTTPTAGSAAAAASSTSFADALPSPTTTTRAANFRDQANIVKLDPQGNLDTFLNYVVREQCTNHVIFDCTNDERIGKFHAAWLRAGVDVVTANNTGLSGPQSQRDEIQAACTAQGKRASAKYLRQVTVGGGLPILNTLRTLLNSGDKVRRIDGIMSVSLSFILARISPPPQMTQLQEFDQRYSGSGSGTTNGSANSSLLNAPSPMAVLLSKDIGTAVPFSQAVKEAVALGLMEEDPTKDLNNEYSSRMLMVLAKELGVDKTIELEDIQRDSDKLLEVIMGRSFSDYGTDIFEDTALTQEIDRQVAARVDAARAKGCVLRHISSVDIRDKEVQIRIVEIPEHHVFAVTPPSCECFRLFTHRHKDYPLIITGPSAGADSTASALLAELLYLMRGKASPRSLALTRSGSSVILHAGGSTTMAAASAGKDKHPKAL